MGMSMRSQALEYGKRRVTRKLIRGTPYLGAVVAAATVAAVMRRKGIFRGGLDTLLDFIPFVGGAKNIVEIARGRDLIADRVRPPR
jgi:hypothetical protein